MATALTSDSMQGQLPMEASAISISHRFDPGMFILHRSVQQNHPILAQLVTWRNSVDLFREQEKRDMRDLQSETDHRPVLSALIGQGEILLCQARMQGVKLDEVGLSFEMVESELRALRDDLKITHDDLISEDEAANIIGFNLNAYSGESQKAS